jgi:uncharacterized protein
MAISLYDATVPSFLQVLGSASGYLEKGLAHCNEHKIDPNDIVESRIHADMLPFRFQIVSVAHHSLGAIEGVQRGLFQPGGKEAPDYASLQKLIADTLASLKAISPAEVNALEGKDVVFQLGERKLPFTAEGFLLSFSLPNFYFHATTAYDILRMKGVSLGKRNFLGQLRMKS